MNLQKSERNYILGSSILIVLFLLFINVFSNKIALQHTNEVTRYEIGYLYNSNNDKAILINDVQVPSFQNSWISLIDKISIDLYNRNLKTFTDNKSVNHRIQLLWKIKLSIRPIILDNYHRHLFPEDPEEPLILS
jgi:hypothetical protein